MESKAMGPLVADRQAAREVHLVNREFSMKSLALKVRHFLKSEDGPTAVEYAVMLALIIVVAIVAIQLLGTTVRDMFNALATELGEIPVDNGL